MAYKFNIYELQFYIFIRSLFYFKHNLSALVLISIYNTYVCAYIALAALEQPWRTTGLLCYYKELHDKCNYLWQTI